MWQVVDRGEHEVTSIQTQRNVLVLKPQACLTEGVV